MAYASGKLLRIKVGNGASPEVFTNVGGARQESFTLNNGPIDISNKDVDDWRQILSGAGVRQATLSISGIFGDSASETTLRTAAAARTVKNYQVILPNGDKWQGPFFIANYTDTGSHDAAMEYSATLESAGALTFTEAP